MIYNDQDLNAFKEYVDTAKHILVLQAEHIDADSLGSSLGLEQLLEDQGKKVTMFCIDKVPDYLKHLPGWDRVTDELPDKFDITILVDSATANQLEKTLQRHKNVLVKKPFIMIDHHASRTGRIEFASLDLCDDTAGASGQQVTEIARHFGWPIDSDSAYALAAAIKADTVNLSTESTSKRTFEAMGYLVENGLDLESLRHNFEQTQSIEPAHVALRGSVLKRAQFFHDDQIAISYYTEEEYKSLGEETLLVEKTKHDLRVVKGVAISVTITERKGYSNASMRANLPVARSVAEHFEGGGHDRAASCRFFNAGHDEVIKKMVPVITKYIDQHKDENQAS